MSNPVMFCDFLKKSYDIVGIVNVMALSSLFILMTQYGLDYPYFYEKEDSESGAKDDLKMEEQIVGNRNDSTGMDLPKKPGFNLFRDASGPFKLLTPEVDLKVKSINLLYILLVPSTTKIAMKIKSMFAKSWISFLRLPLPLDIYKEQDLLLGLLELPAKDLFASLSLVLASVNLSPMVIFLFSGFADGWGVVLTVLPKFYYKLNDVPDTQVLVSLHQAVFPQLSNPIMFCDFLTRLYGIGGVVSVVALSSLFIHGLEYRYFYEKLLVSCVTSTLLPAHLAAAFAKQQNRLSPSVLPARALVVVVPICNLLQRHPSINCLVLRVSCKRMATRSLLQSLLLLLLLLLWVPRAVSEVGTASYYGPPYERTECYGEGSSQFPKSNLFAAVSDGLWDLGRACGREYEVRCISDAQSGPGPCKPGSGAIRVKAVDYALSVESSASAPRQSVAGADLVLSQAAFEAIANPSADSISVDFKEL